VYSFDVPRVVGSSGLLSCHGPAHGKGAIELPLSQSWRPSRKITSLTFKLVSDSSENNFSLGGLCRG
jgi:hypothetical protein